MRRIDEYLLSKSTKRSVVKATSDNIRSIVWDELNELGRDADLNHIDVSEVTDMDGLFSERHFCGDVSEWDVSNVRTMRRMFYRNDNFNCDISKWNTRSLEDMSTMFYDCFKFNQDLGAWETSNVKNLDLTFCGCHSFDGKGLSKWDISSVTSLNGTFMNARKFTEDISAWDVSNVADASNCFMNCEALRLDLSKWRFTNAKSLANLFWGCSCINFDVSDLYDGHGMWNASGMFCRCPSFTGKGLEKWDMSSVTRADNMFNGCKKLNVDLSGWDVSRIYTAISMFEDCASLNFDASKMNFGIKHKSNSIKMFRNSGIKPSKQWKL